MPLGAATPRRRPDPGPTGGIMPAGSARYACSGPRQRRPAARITPAAAGGALPGGGLVGEQDVAGAEGTASSSRRPIRSIAVRNSDKPSPSTTGLTMIRSSSTSPRRSRLTVRSKLPKIAMSLPGCCLSLVTSSAASSSTSRELAHPALSRVREKTTFGRSFIAAAVFGSPSRAAGVGQYDAISS